METMTRRQLLKYGATGGASVFLLGRFDVRGAPAATAGAATPTLDPSAIQKYQTALIVPPAMPRTRRIVARGAISRTMRHISFTFPRFTMILA